MTKRYAFVDTVLHPAAPNEAARKAARQQNFSGVWPSARHIENKHWARCCWLMDALYRVLAQTKEVASRVVVDAKDAAALGDRQLFAFEQEYIDAPDWNAGRSGIRVGKCRIIDTHFLSGRSAAW
jgi:hypothetical protein